MAKKYQEYASITSMQDRGKAKKHSELFSYGMGPPSWLDDVRGQNMGSTRLHKRLKGLDIDVHISTQEKPRALLELLKKYVVDIFSLKIIFLVFLCRIHKILPAGRPVNIKMKPPSSCWFSDEDTSRVL